MRKHGINKNKKALFLNDTTDWYHFGCTATCIAIKEEVKGLEFDVTSLPITETYKLNSVPTEFLEFQSRVAFEAFKKNNLNTVELLQDHDVILINGEGTLHGLRPAPLGLLYIAL